MYHHLIVLPAMLLLSLAGCTDQRKEEAISRPAARPLPPEFAAYWFQGQAEISTYEVEQERYGEMRSARQVNIFVTEDFSARRQVKLDHPEKAGADRVPVLKLNALRRFQTGIYDYSLMLSVFTPLDAIAHPRTLKTTCSVQDWCGQTFTQLNLSPEGYRLRGYSYFETESDRDTLLAAATTEDELWTRLRLDPSAIDTGRVELVPASFYLRLRHQPFRSRPARLSLRREAEAAVLQLEYADLPRRLVVRFDPAFPYRIFGWEETDAGKVMSRGRLVATVLAPYWTQHGNADAPLRDTLGLRF